MLFSAAATTLGDGPFYATLCVIRDDGRPQYYKWEEPFATEDEAISYATHLLTEPMNALKLVINRLTAVGS